MALFSKSELENRIIQKSIYSSESTVLREGIKNFCVHDSAIVYDVFLSHSYKDKKAVLALADEFKNKYKLNVYIDWLEDSELDRTHVNAKTAQTIKERMQNCKCLLYATSENSSSSKWMPWETGLMDGLKGRVAICPLIGGDDSNFRGQEYLSMYPFISYEKAEGSDKDVLWINKGSMYVNFTDWLKGKEPYTHI